MQLTAPARRTTDANGTTRTARRTGIHDTDGMAVAAFVLGLLGLLVLNVFLGPIAIALASVALWRGTARRGRALLGLGLGVADLLVLAVFMSADNTMSWSL
ncbi:DUF4190 domain-containing protein [Streptomyces coelicoflavus]|uniref:DUF4190 domain-containing protein n=1 Tax=Streptomyces coelicoflavus TaxID=285562 RepID=A0A6N9USN5_9ACTN|nr:MULTISPECIES: hypothetical protein [Streptomyces]EHN75734.1 hypothetical protein SMCF_4813 [Streptomyces coelicoflavus ZG0656]KPC72257.1 hypothetical protein ADL35_31705 [Streptomyces sp. NRRL WC-3753]MZE42404.1 DUF4190 domain-containing protein [Streptomyces sp. SID5477]NEB20841.1 DUF4190 domain-containing protein [Streptomyces coelicoflavus]OWA16958.1 DUF4190 domain-containing protein [Streptomyces sp. CS159]